MFNKLSTIRQRLHEFPNYKYFLLEKILSVSFSYLLMILMFIPRYFSFGSIKVNSCISIKTSFKNLKNIYIGSKVTINNGVVLWAGIKKGIYIDRQTQINPYVVIYGDVKIGKYVMIAPHVMLAGGGHGYKDVSIPMIFQESTSKGGIIIEDDVWIGANSTIVDGVTVGKGAIVAAGSVVVQNVAAFDIVAGVPARKIKSRIN